VNPQAESQWQRSSPGRGVFKRDKRDKRDKSIKTGFFAFWKRDKRCFFTLGKVSFGQCLQGLSPCHGCDFFGVVFRLIL
jgi:hypothetical protein